jgi:hypothetical protein
MIQVAGYDPKTSLIHYSHPMSRYGLNPYGDPMYRIVLNGSRRNMLGGIDGKTGVVGYHWAVTYDRIPMNSWILEKWLSPSEFTDLSKEQWDLEYRDPVTGLLLLGPFPDRGDYQLVISIAPEDIVDFNIEKLIQWQQMGRDHTLGERIDALARQYAAEEKAKDEILEGTLREKLPAFGVRPIFSSKVRRGSERAEGRELPILVTN